MGVSLDMDFLCWAALHPNPRDVAGAPGWARSFEGPEQTGGPWWAVAVRHRDGREFDFRVDLWLRGPENNRPFNMSIDGCVLVELHDRYPEEYPEVEFIKQPSVPAESLLSEAFDAYFNDDMEKFEDRILAAKRSLGRT